MATAALKAVDWHLWVSGDLFTHHAACQALALRAAIGIRAEIFVSGPAHRFVLKETGAPAWTPAESRLLQEWRERRVTPADLLARARTLATINLTVCSLTLDLCGFSRPNSSIQVDGAAGAASFWQRLPLGAAPLVF